MGAAAMRALHMDVCSCTFCQNAHIDMAQSFHADSGVILFWLLAILVTVIACAALYYAAAGRAVHASAAAVDDATAAHFRLQLDEIDADIASGRLGEAEGTAARSEVARELIRMKKESRVASDSARRQTPVLLMAIGATALRAFGAYSALGNPDMPSAPLAGRPLGDMTLAEAVARIEAQL